MTKAVNEQSAELENQQNYQLTHITKTFILIENNRLLNTNPLQSRWYDMCSSSSLYKHIVPTGLKRGGVHIHL